MKRKDKAWLDRFSLLQFNYAKEIQQKAQEVGEVQKPSGTKDSKASRKKS